MSGYTYIEYLFYFKWCKPCNPVTYILTAIDFLITPQNEHPVNPVTGGV